LENSLKTLHTDHFDLYQLHAVTEVGKDIDAVIAKGGAMETLIEAKKEGRVRYLGFSAHSVEAAVAAMDRFAFDSILFPVNFAMYEKGNFGPQIMEKAQAKGLTRLALKAMALQKWSSDDAPGRKRFPKCWYEPIADLELASPALRFTLSQPVTAAIPPGEESLFRLALMIALRYTPITPEEVEDLKGIAAKLAPPFEAVG
jgi:aryl-alcohol dehydrogenase-like predicted oxidoreductase